MTVVGVAGIAIAAGVLTLDGAYADERPAAGSAPSREVASQAEALVAEHAALARRPTSQGELSRSAERSVYPGLRRPAKKPALTAVGQELGGALKATVPLPTPRAIASSLLPSYGWDSSQFSCLDELWTRESNWNPRAVNASSGAYGIPQALPGAKMSTVARDWSTNAETQIKWGLWYIRASYGSPCGAWYFWESHSWY